MKRKIEAKRKATTETETKASNQIPLPEEEVICFYNGWSTRRSKGARRRNYGWSSKALF